MNQNHVTSLYIQENEDELKQLEALDNWRLNLLERYQQIKTKEETITEYDDRTEYRKGDHLHRETGAAVIYKNGIKKWYTNGVIRQVENAVGDIIEYYENGVLHRDDGPAKIDEKGNMFYYRHGVLHRERGPAVMFINGKTQYYKMGRLHRDDGPANVTDEGVLEWYQNGELHREHGPARVSSDFEEWYFFGKPHSIDDNPAFKSNKGESTRWMQKGILHRENGPALITPDGIQIWYKNGKIHRENGPAIEYPDGTKKWMWYGLLHRETGPAVENADGTKIWAIKNQIIPTPKQIEIYLVNNSMICYDVTNLNDRVITIEFDLSDEEFKEIQSKSPTKCPLCHHDAVISPGPFDMWCRKTVLHDLFN